MSDSQDRIDTEASEWFAKRQMFAADMFDQQGFDAWLAADPRHAAAFEDMQAAHALIAGLNMPLTMETPRQRRWGWAAATGLALAASMAGFLILTNPRLSAPQAQYETAVAELREVALPDGSTVTLGASSRFELRFSGRERRIALSSGEAFFDVAHDPSRPFFVDVGGAEVRVVGTKFDVRRGGDHVRVSVAEGVVQVRPAAPLFAQRETLVLRSGDRADMTEDFSLFQGQAPQLSQTAPESPGAWQEGRLIYVEAPLSELVADLNRYYAPGVRLTDPSLEEFRLTASFRARDLDVFLETLPSTAPVTVRRGSAGEIMIDPALR